MLSKGFHCQIVAVWEFISKSVYLNTWCLCQKGQYKFHHGFKSFKSPQQNAMDGL
jgi:hypothetical protein